jgi:hypothetical protein
MRRPDICALENIIFTSCHQEVKNMISGDEEAKTGFFQGLFVPTVGIFAQFVFFLGGLLLHSHYSVDPTDAVSLATPPDF